MSGVGKCKIKDCPLFGGIEVPYVGNRKANIVWIGESPGVEEERKLQPFVGRSGKMSRQTCIKAGLNWKRMFVLNSARCRIDKKAMSGKEVTKTLKCCRSYVERALLWVRPKLIIAVGDFAMRQVIRKSGITKARGKWVWSKEFECWVLPIFHPAYVMRNMAMMPIFESDIDMIVDFVRNGYKPPEQEGGAYSEGFTPLVPGTVYAVDSETQGLDWLDPNFLCISYSVSSRPGTGSNVTLFEECSEEDSDFSIFWDRHAEGQRKKVQTEVFVKNAENFEAKMDYLKELLENPDYKLYMMNGNFDIHVFTRLFRDHGHCLHVTSYLMDVQVAANLYEENIYKMASLSSLQQSFTDVKFDYNEDFAKTYDKEDMLSVPPEAMVAYAGADADITLQVGKELERKLLRTPRVAKYLVRFAMPTLQSLAEMEEAGALVDMQALPVVQEEVRQLMLEEQRGAWAEAATKVKDEHRQKGLKLTRDVFVRDVLFHADGFHLKPVRFTAAKVPSVDKATRMELLDRRISQGARRFIEHYSKWSEYNTLYTRYLKGFAKAVKVDGRIHTHYSLTQAVTGRVSSSAPNLMNIPKRSGDAKLIRRLITAPEGYKLLAIDQSQSELRWMAHVAKDPEMIRIFRAGDLDIHTETAKSLHIGDWDKTSKGEQAIARRNAKAVNFGLLYGMSTGGFVKYAKQEYGVELSMEQAESWIEIFFGKYTRLRRYHSDTIDSCRMKGYVESPFGRRRRLPEITSDDGALRSSAERMAINHPVQSPSSDGVLIACNELRRKKLLNPEECRAILFIHDELVFEVRDNGSLVDNAKVIIEEMENPPLEKMFGVKLSVPLVAEAKVGDNLADMSELEV